MASTRTEIHRVFRKLPLWQQALIVIVLAIGALWFRSPQPDLDAMTPAPVEVSVPIASDSARVVRVVDGDTIRVDLNGVEETVRLVGVNTPETVDPRRPVECFGKEASNAMKELLLNQVVRLESDPTQSDRDRYSRLLRFVFLPDGTDIGLALIQEGLAVESLYSNVPHRYYEQYITAQAEAEAAERGFWSQNACGGGSL
jgi:micrococcal nuclease